MTNAVYRFARYRLLPGQRLLEADANPVRLGGRALDALVVLVERRDRTVSKRELIELVWPRLVVEENNLQVQVMTLRKLLGYGAIATVPGRGYRFMLPVQMEGDEGTVAPGGAHMAEDGVPRRGNVPLYMPELFGRHDDLRRLIGMIPQHSLVTIAGAGGIGKTRLAQAVAGALKNEWPGGVWWIDLSALSDAAQIEEAVAQAMGIGARAGHDSAIALWNALSAQAAMLVLDNAEHLLRGVAAFATRVLEDAPQVRLLVTTQEALRVAGEQVLRPEPLALPEGDDPATIAASAAVALFVARAQAVSRHFVLNKSNSVAVADICRRLDGIPLAIELAAARAPLLGIEGLRDRLDQRFHVLTGGQRTSMRRHQTLRAALEWSYELLSPHEQAVLRKLAVFVGGFTLEAAQQVAEDNEAIDLWDVLEHLGALVDKSLVIVESERLPRYRLLESTRLFALERLIEVGEAAAVRSRHLDHFLSVAETAREKMLVADPRGLAQLDLERDNLMLALAWRPAGEDAGRALRLVAALRLYWTSRGMLKRGLESAQAAVLYSKDQPACGAQCQVLSEISFLQRQLGDLPAAGAAADAAVSMARQLGDPALLCRVLSVAGHNHLSRGERALAVACAEEALALTGAIGDCPETANAMSLQSAIHSEVGETGLAVQWERRMLALRERMGHLWSQAVTHLNLSSLRLDLGQPETAMQHLRQTLALLPRLDSEYVGVFLLDATAAWAADAGLPDVAVQLDTASTRQMRRLGINSPTDRPHRARLERARIALEEGRRTELEMRGGELNYVEALELVAQVLSAGTGQGFSEGKA